MNLLFFIKFFIWKIPKASKINLRASDKENYESVKILLRNFVVVMKNVLFIFALCLISCLFSCSTLKFYSNKVVRKSIKDRLWTWPMLSFHKLFMTSNWNELRVFFSSKFQFLTTWGNFKVKSIKKVARKDENLTLF